MSGPNVENIRKWVEALRSGDFKQGYGSLIERSDEGRPVGHCCLGVACEVSGLPFESRETHWPSRVQDFYGLDNSPEVVLDRVVNGSNRASLIDLNDCQGFSFEQIADAIEAEWLAGDPDA